MTGVQTCALPIFALAFALNVLFTLTVLLAGIFTHVEYANVSPVATLTYANFVIFVALIVNESVYVCPFFTLMFLAFPLLAPSM